MVGAGPGVGGAVARRFAQEGYAVGLVGRTLPPLEALGTQLQESGTLVGWAQADVTDAPALRAAVIRLCEHGGRIDVLHFNPSAYRPKDPLTLTSDELLADLALGAGGLLTAVQAARPYLRRGGRVTATGSVAADRPSPAAASLGAQKAALRNLVHSLDRSLQPHGIRAVSVTVDGVLEREDLTSPLHPRQVAEAIFAAAQQPEVDWRSEVRHPA